jgi:transposase InsO family protein
MKSVEIKGEQSRLRELVWEVFFRHSRRYGSRRIEAELKAEGVEMGRHRIRKIMKEEGLRAIQPRSYVPKTTRSSHRLGYSENLLLRMKLPPVSPNKVIVGDITYLPLQGGSFAYLATWIDLFSRLVMGWEVQDNLQERVVTEKCIARFRMVLMDVCRGYSVNLYVIAVGPVARRRGSS